MRIAVSLICVVVSSCAVNTDPETSTGSSALTESSDSVNWDPAVGCSSGPKVVVVPCDGEFLWPAEQGIKSIQVLYRKGPDGSDGPTFLAFVIWDDNTVGRILRATAGRNGTHLRTTVNNIIAARASSAPDHSSSSAGNLSGGTSPAPPHPHIDEAIHFSDKYLVTAKLAAKNLRVAGEQFTSYSE
jgi:hypothetical protein